MFFNFSFGQNYKYTEISIRDFEGKFTHIDKEGDVVIKGSKIYIFDQELEVKSKNYCFNERGISMGFMYGCTDGTFWYTILITNDGILYFKNKEAEMFRIKLKKL